MGRSGRERQVCGRSRETAEVDRAYLNKTGSVGLRATDTADEGKAWIQKDGPIGCSKGASGHRMQ